MKSTISLLSIVLCFFTTTTADEFNECYECTSRGVSHRCADPFRLVGRGKHIKTCESGWCAKIEVGLGGEDGVGFTERKCLLYSVPDGIERCGHGSYKGQLAFMCFCRGHLCNSNSNILPSKLILLFVIIYNVTEKFN